MHDEPMQLIRQAGDAVDVDAWIFPEMRIIPGIAVQVRKFGPAAVVIGREREAVDNFKEGVALSRPSEHGRQRIVYRSILRLIRLVCEDVPEGGRPYLVVIRTGISIWCRT